MWAHIAAYHSNVKGPFPEGPFQTVTAIDASWTDNLLPPPTYSSFNYLIDFPATANSKGLSVLQLHRFAGDAQKGRNPGSQWYQAQVQAACTQNKALVIAQHYGWDSYSIGAEGPWWSDAERAAALAPLTANGVGYKNIVGIFHGHNHAPLGNYLVPGTQDLWAIDPGGAVLGYLGVCRISNITDPANGQMQIDMAFGQVTSGSSLAFDNVWSLPPS
jgi:cytolysin (calcineurin-like family phosphatase)